MLLGTPLWDVNGTPKVFSSDFIKDLKLESDGDLIDAEVMAKISPVRAYKSLKY